MFKFFALGLFLYLKLGNDGPSQVEAGPYDVRPKDLTPRTTSTKNESSENLTTGGEYNFYAGRQIFYLIGPFELNDSKNFTRNLDPEYIVTNGTAFKLHRRRFAWNKARNTCIEEGGHLAIIKTHPELRTIWEMLINNSVEQAWVGYHEHFETKDWASVLDEPLLKSSIRWQEKLQSHPYRGKRCACLLCGSGAIDDKPCKEEIPFVCKISNV